MKSIRILIWSMCLLFMSGCKRVDADRTRQREEGGSYVRHPIKLPIQKMQFLPPSKLKYNTNSAIIQCNEAGTGC